MYLGSDFHRYWAKCGHASMHPDDREYLGNDAFTFDKGISPWPFDGALDQAKVVFCLANPSCEKVMKKDELNQMIVMQRSGEEALPYELDPSFGQFYKKILRPIDLPIGAVSRQIAVINACPYSSPRMTEQQVRVASGLPSLWQAQKYLRETLIPRALTGNIYLIMIRRHTLWGMAEPESQYGKLRVIKGRELGAVISKELGLEIKQWLISKGYVDWELPLNERGNTR